VQSLVPIGSEMWICIRYKQTNKHSSLYIRLHVKHTKIGVKICQEYRYVLNLLQLIICFGRPDPVYPTPQVDKTAAKCRKDVCLLPDCSCGGKDIPGTVLTSCVIPKNMPSLQQCLY